MCALEAYVINQICANTLVISNSSHSRDDDCWGVHPELPYIAHSHNSRCSVCLEYGAHLALVSAAQLRTYQHACYNLIHLQDHLLQCRSVEDIDRMLHHTEADNEDLQSDNAHLQEENDELKARLVSMGPLQPQPATADAPLQCHDRDIPPHPVHPQSRLHAALFALNSPHPNLIHIQTLSPPVLTFMCILQHLRHLCKCA